jgi:hypothetical protein
MKLPGPGFGIEPREDIRHALADAAARVELFVTIAKPPAGLKLGPCFLTHYSTATNGYAQVAIRGEGNEYVHRVIFETFVRDLAEGETVDHLCKVRRCVAPRHLVARTRPDHTALHNREKKGQPISQTERAKRARRRVREQGGRVYFDPTRIESRQDAPEPSGLPWGTSREF